MPQLLPLGLLEKEAQSLTELVLISSFAGKIELPVRARKKCVPSVRDEGGRKRVQEKKKKQTLCQD